VKEVRMGHGDTPLAGDPPPPEVPQSDVSPPGEDWSDGGPSAYEIKGESDVPPPGEDWSDGGPSVYEIKGEPDGVEPAGAGGSHVAKWAAIAASGIAAIVIGIILAMGGGDEDSATKPADESTVTKKTTSGGGGGSGSDLAAAGLPTDLAYTATGRTTFRSTIRVNSTCSGKTCTYSSAFNPGAGLVRGPIPTVNWSHAGATWQVVLTAPILSSSTNGADCVYLYTDTWDLTTQESQSGGGLLRAVRLTGTLRRDTQMDPSRSQGVGVTCLPYSNSDTYTVTATPA
jgi:hypothetical protein